MLPIKHDLILRFLANKLYKWRVPVRCQIKRGLSKKKKRGLSVKTMTPIKETSWGYAAQNKNVFQ